jgi:transcription elongation factor Elf1
MTEISTPDLLPCPFCASTRVGLDDSVGGSFVSCDLCEARGPSVEYELIDHLEGISREVSVRDASAAAVAAWNQRNITFKPLPESP